MPFRTGSPGRERRQDPASLLLDERRQFQTQARSIADNARRMMMSDDLNSVVRHRFAVTVMKLKTGTLPR
jgi:hypothetical protein